MTRLAALATAVVLVAACTPLAQRPASPTPPALPATTRPQAYTAEPAKHHGGIATVGSADFPAGLSPILPAGTSASALDTVLFSGLLGISPDLGWYPDLAAEVPQPPGADGVLHYRLRSGLEWSDGQPLTADDVIYTWQLVSGAGNPYRASQAGYDQISAIDRVSDTDLAIHFKKPYPSYPLLFGYVLPKHRLGGTDLSKLSQDPYWAKPDVVSGAFQIQELVDGDHITLVPNPHYADGRSGLLGHQPYLEKLIFKVFSDKQALLAALKAGEVDAAIGLGEHDLDSVAAMTSLRVRLAPTLQYEQLSFNQANPNPATGAPPPWAGDPELLHALDLSLDRPSLLNGLLRNRAPAALSPLTPALPALADSALPARSYDPKQAAAILDADGWLRGPDGVRSKNGRRLSFVLTTTDGNQLRSHEEEIIVSGWKKVGAEVQIQNVAADALFAGLSQGGVLASGHYLAALWAWVLPPDGDAEYPIFDSSEIPGSQNGGAGSNYSRCSSPAIDAALAAGRSTYDPSQRAAAYKSFQAAYVSARCELPLFEHVDVTATAQRLHNHSPNPAPVGDLWNAADWWVDG